MGDWTVGRRGSQQQASSAGELLDFRSPAPRTCRLSLALALASVWYAHLSPSAQVFFSRSNERWGSFGGGLGCSRGVGAGVSGGGGTLPRLAPLGSLPLPEGGGGEETEKIKGKGGEVR